MSQSGTLPPVAMTDRHRGQPWWTEHGLRWPGMCWPGRMKYDEVARQVGYANRGTAHRAVAQALSERLVDGIDELRALEVARLDAMQAALWPPQVEAGDTRASMTVIRIIDRRCRLLGLDATKRARQRFDTLVIGEESNPGEATDERERARTTRHEGALQGVRLAAQ